MNHGTAASRTLTRDFAAFLTPRSAGTRRAALVLWVSWVFLFSATVTALLGETLRGPGPVGPPLRASLPRLDAPSASALVAEAPTVQVPRPPSRTRSRTRARVPAPVPRAHDRAVAPGPSASPALGPWLPGAGGDP